MKLLFFLLVVPVLTIVLGSPVFEELLVAMTASAGCSHKDFINTLVEVQTTSPSSPEALS
jgi:hypothetical protein